MTVKTMGAPAQPAGEALAPIVVDLGKTRRSRIKKLKNGEGPLLGEVEEILAQVRASLGARAEQMQLVPVVLIYRKKSKNRKIGLFGV